MRNKIQNCQLTYYISFPVYVSLSKIQLLLRCTSSDYDLTYKLLEVLQRKSFWKVQHKQLGQRRVSNKAFFPQCSPLLPTHKLKSGLLLKPWRNTSRKNKRYSTENVSGILLENLELNVQKHPWLRSYLYYETWLNIEAIAYQQLCKKEFTFY